MIAPPGRTLRAACWATTKVPRMLVRCRASSGQVQVGDGREGHAAGGVHDDVDAAVLALGRVEQRGDGLLVGDVGLDGDGPAAGRGDLLDRGLGQVRLPA